MISEIDFNCPICNTDNQVLVVERDHLLCSKCNTCWEIDDINKRNYVCPLHNNDLKAYYSRGKVVLKCQLCRKSYFIPRVPYEQDEQDEQDELTEKLKEAYIIEEHL